MIEQLWIRIIIFIFCLILSFLIGISGCDRKKIDDVKGRGKVIIELEREDDEEEDCHGGVCPPPEDYYNDG